MTEQPEPTPHHYRAAGREETDDVRCVNCDAGMEMADIACPTPGNGMVRRTGRDGVSPDYWRFLEGEISSKDYAASLIEEVQAERERRFGPVPNLGLPPVSSGRSATADRPRVRQLSMSPDFARYLAGEISSEDYARRLFGIEPESEADPRWECGPPEDEAEE